ncbi:hypothetical protein BRADI_1g29083v3 [Brachypodium distachyon]|uniref:Uncharacterized protein n=1 Tax=Brachypodium distachyon TaxID=15368 RepID=A0A0Q3NGN7_BRADI|nr:hypothetical protein BRADI_1g29083v3 [Brachypodium distachyon]
MSPPASGLHRLLVSTPPSLPPSPPAMDFDGTESETGGEHHDDDFRSTPTVSLYTVICHVNQIHINQIPNALMVFLPREQEGREIILAGNERGCGVGCEAVMAPGAGIVPPNFGGRASQFGEHQELLLCSIIFASTNLK